MTQAQRARPIGFDQIPEELRSSCWCGAPLSEAVAVVEHMGSFNAGDGGPMRQSYSFSNQYRCPDCDQVWKIRP